MDDFLKYTGKDILDLTDEEFFQALLEYGAKDEELKPVDFDRLDAEYRKDRGIRSGVVRAQSCDRLR